MSQYIPLCSDNLVIIPEPRTPHSVCQTWRQFHKPSANQESEQQNQGNPLS